MKKLLIEQYVERHLSSASYEHDPTLDQWMGWIEAVPGVYAQQKTMEETRDELAEVLEEHLLLSLRNAEPEREIVPEFAPFYAHPHLAA